MNRMMFFALACIPAIVMAEAAKLGTELTPEQRKARKEKFFNEKYGGQIIDRSGQRGSFLYINMQKSADPKLFSKSIADLTNLVRSDIRVKDADGEFSFGKAAEIMRTAGANAAVFLVESDALPSLLVAPEGNWALINVRPLVADKPSEAFLGKRLSREVWRSFAFLCGVHASDPRSVMQKVNSVKDLDELIGEQFGPEVIMSVPPHLKSLGIQPYKVTTYLAQCKAGKAAAPTNDYQRAIWNQVHEIPDKPIKIKYNEARDAGK